MFALAAICTALTVGVQLVAVWENVPGAAVPLAVRVTAVATLTVLVPPSIVSQPTNQTAVAGSDVGFSVAASGSMPLSYQWFFNGSVLPGATATNLNLLSVQSANAGNYWVVITNISGAVTSSVATPRRKWALP